MTALIQFIYPVTIILIVLFVVFFALYFNKREEVLKLKRENVTLFEEKIREAKQHKKEINDLWEFKNREIQDVINSVHERVKEIMKKNEIQKLHDDHFSFELEIQSSDLKDGKVISTYIFELKKKCKEKEIENAVLEEENQELKKKLRNMKENMD